MIDSKPSLVPDPASRPITTIWLSAPPNSFQLEILPVKISDKSLKESSEMLLLGFTTIAIPSIARTVPFKPLAISLSFNALEERPISQRPSLTA